MINEAFRRILQMTIIESYAGVLQLSVIEAG